MLQFGNQRKEKVGDQPKVMQEARGRSGNREQQPWVEQCLNNGAAARPLLSFNSFLPHQRAEEVGYILLSVALQVWDPALEPHLLLSHQDKEVRQQGKPGLDILTSARLQGGDASTEQARAVPSAITASTISLFTEQSLGFDMAPLL